MRRRTSPARGASPEPRARLRGAITPALRLALLSLGLLLARGAVAAQVNETSHECEFPTRDSRVVIIIDDIGHSLRRGRAALALPGRLTYAVIPHTPYGVRLAEAAHEAGKEVMLHTPMSTLERTPLDAGGLTGEQSREEFLSTFATSLEQIPHVRGINNHMGSELTQHRRQMAWLMQELRWQDLYFVDSRTTEKTVAATVADEFRVPHLSRDVFLDNDRDPQAIERKFRELLARAQRDGLAVGIGHPYPETIAYLEEVLPTLYERGFKPVFASEAVEPREEKELAGVGPILSGAGRGEPDTGC